MKVLIDISEEMFKATQTYYSYNTTRLSIKSCIEKIANGTPIPDNATNGDVLKIIFPNTEWEEIHDLKGNKSIGCTNEFFNAPYKEAENDI